MSARYQTIDLMRGIAILLMVIYHFCFDLTSYGYTDFDFYKDPFWLNFRTLILSSFLFLVGFSMWLATLNGKGNRIRWRKVSRRTGLILANAVLISIVTWYIFGERYIYFGVLHFVTLASLLVLPFIRLYWLNLILGVGLLTLSTYQSTFFDQVNLNWIGMMTYKPFTEDYVPLIPWFGVVLLGLFAAQNLSKSDISVDNYEPKWISRINLLKIAGRHSLLVYMLHQPILMGILELVELL